MPHIARKSTELTNGTPSTKASGKTYVGETGKLGGKDRTERALPAPGIRTGSFHPLPVALSNSRVTLLPALITSLRNDLLIYRLISRRWLSDASPTHAGKLHTHM